MLARLLPDTCLTFDIFMAEYFKPSGSIQSWKKQLIIIRGAVRTGGLPLRQGHCDTETPRATLSSKTEQQIKRNVNVEKG